MFQLHDGYHLRILANIVTTHVTCRFFKVNAGNVFLISHISERQALARRWTKFRAANRVVVPKVFISPRPARGCPRGCSRECRAAPVAAPGTAPSSPKQPQVAPVAAHGGVLARSVVICDVTTTEDDTTYIAFCRNSLSKPSGAFHSLYVYLLPATIGVAVREESAKAYEVVRELGNTVSRGRWYV